MVFIGEELCGNAEHPLSKGASPCRVTDYVSASPEMFLKTANIRSERRLPQTMRHCYVSGQREALQRYMT
jgi:hypothetical protein